MAGIGTGAAGLTASLNYHQSLSIYLTESLEEIATCLITIQNQLDSLAVLVLQNRRGLDLLMPEKLGLCLFLEEACCFYANTSKVVKEESGSHSVVSDSLLNQFSHEWLKCWWILEALGLDFSLLPLQPGYPLYSPWNSLGQNTGVGSLSLLQGIFPTQGSNSGLPHCRQILYQLSYQAVKGAARNLANRVSRIRHHFSHSWKNWLSNWNWVPWVLSLLGPHLLLTLILTFCSCLMHLFSKFLQDRLRSPTELSN